MRRFVISVLLVSLLAVLAVAGTTLAKPAGKGNNLTPEQREQFVTGAKEVAGLDDAQIAAALKDPEAIAGIPVNAETEEIEVGTVTAQDQNARTTDAAAANCNGIQRQVNYSNVRGKVLGYFHVSQDWCWNFSAVTYVSTPKVTAEATAFGASKGWKYRGVTRQFDYYAPYDGFSHGSHVSLRQGTFKICTGSKADGNRSCFTKMPKVRFVLNYDGSGYSTAKT